MTNVEWAYIAGVVDGDGCIQAPVSGNHHRIELHVIQRDIQIIDFLYQRFGGSINIVDRKHKSGLKHYIRFMITGPKCKAILEGIEPYLVLKKEQARLGIKLQSIILPKGNAKKLSKEVIETRTQLALGIRSLNSPATTECVGSHTREMRQSELTQMKNRENGIRSGSIALEN